LSKTLKLIKNLAITLSKVILIILFAEIGLFAKWHNLWHLKRSLCRKSKGYFRLGVRLGVRLSVSLGVRLGVRLGV
jgi:hypothetical protein